MLKIILSLITIALLIYNLIAVYTNTVEYRLHHSLLTKVKYEQKTLINSQQEIIEELKGDLEFMTTWKDELSAELDRLK